jgi:MATE family multidrug resistance protein
MGPLGHVIEEARAQLRLALPVVVVQVGLVGLGVVDNAFMGRVSAGGLAAIATAHSLTFVWLGLAMGTLSVLDPLVSQAWGAGDAPAIARAQQRGLVLAALLAAVTILVCLPAESVLALLHQPAEVVPLTARVVRIHLVGFAPFLVFVALRQGLQATHCLRPIVVVVVLANAVNALLDWILITGRLGFAPGGAIGCAWATALVRWGMALGLVAAAWPRLAPRLVPWQRAAFDRRALARMLRLGLPIGLSFALEIGAFAAVLFSMGQLGEIELAGHQVAMSIASTSFMIPLGISMAASVRVGNEIGAERPQGARRAAAVAIVAGGGAMILSAIVFLLWPAGVGGLVTDLPEVLAVAVVLIPIAGLFQIADGLQAVAMGCLRGTADTRVPFLIHLVGFWGVAIPVGRWLGFSRGLGAAGLWWGLAAGLTAVAFVQLWRLLVRLRGPLERVSVDG